MTEPFERVQHFYLLGHFYPLPGNVPFVRLFSLIAQHRTRMVALLCEFPLRDLRPRFSLQLRARHPVPLQRLCVALECGHQPFDEFLGLRRPIYDSRLSTAQVGLDAGW